MKKTRVACFLHNFNFVISIQFEDIVQGGVILKGDHYFVRFKVFNLDMQVQSSSRGCICVLCCVSSPKYCCRFLGEVRM